MCARLKPTNQLKPQFELEQMSRVPSVFQPSCLGRSDHVHLRTAGNGSCKWAVGGRWRPGSNQTGGGGLSHYKFNCICSSLFWVWYIHIWKFFLQALVNMGEILKAAGCGYDNGKETPYSTPYNIINLVILKFHLPNQHCYLSIVSCSCQSHSAVSRHEWLQCRQRCLQDV